VIYEADKARGDLGWFHCAHSHCDGRPVGDVIALFTDEELGNPKRCGATTKSGKKCAAETLYSDGKCMFHSQTTEARCARSSASRCARIGNDVEQKLAVVQAALARRQ
jgi:hypothetical protein